jgi:hypothetical protein
MLFASAAPPAGKVVSMGATAKLHPVGKNFIGYPW